MKRIGIRQLRQHASVYLRQVAAGETIEVTDRGRPVARLVPVPAGDAVARLVAEGRASDAEAALDELGPPLPPRQGVPLPAAALEAARDAER